MFLLACFIIGLVLVIIFAALYSPEYVTNLGKELFRVTPFYEGARNGILIGNAVLLVALCTFIYFMTKKVLHQVFFKPYKLFKLELSITCIRARMVWLYIILSMSLGIPMGIFVYYLHPGEIAEMIINWITSCIEIFIVTFYFVRKYAKVIEK